MPDLPTKLDLRDIGRAKLLAVNVEQKRVKWEPVLMNTDGADLALLIGAAAEVAYQVVMQLAYKSANVFLDSSDGVNLDRWGNDHYQVPRKVITNAVGFVRMFRPATTVTPAVIPPALTASTTNTTSKTTSSYVVSGSLSDTVGLDSTDTNTVVTNPDGTATKTQTTALTVSSSAGTVSVKGQSVVETTSPPIFQTPATPEIVVYNDLPAGTVEIGTRLSALDGTQYQTTETVSFGEGQTEAFVRVQATQPGKLYQVGTNQIQSFVNLEDLFDANLLVLNVEPTAGGEPDEDDEIYRERLRRFWNAARKSTTRALVYGAITVPGVVSASVDEIDIPDFIPFDTRPDMPDAEVQVLLTIADSSGVANRALTDDVQRAMIDYRAGGIHVTPVNSTPQLVQVMLKLTFLAGIETTSVVFRIRQATAELVNNLGVNQVLRVAELQHLLVGFEPAGLVVNDSSVVSPITDLYPDPGSTIRMRLDDVLLAD